MNSQILPFLILMSAGGVYFFVHLLYFVWLPQRAIKKYRQADPERLRRYLEFVCATPSLMGANPGIVARTALVPIYIARREYARAEAHCRANLKSLTKSRRSARFDALEGDNRRHLANCLEGLGRPIEADAERLAAEACVTRAPSDTLRHLTQGKLLERENRHEEAVAEYENALIVTPESNRAAWIGCMAHLSLACHNAGRPAESLRWSEQTIAAGAEGLILRSVHKIAGIVCGNLGRFDDAEGHYQRARELAQAERNPKEVVEILCLLAEIQRKRGRLEQAYQACEEASKIEPRAIRHARNVKTQILRDWGRYDEALHLLSQNDQAEKLPTPAAQRRVDAVSAAARARIEVSAGRIDEAWANIQQAVAELGNDAKLGLWCDAVAAWVFAARGLGDDSRRIADETESRLPEFEQSPGTCKAILHDLGMAAWTRSDFEDGDVIWTRFLDLDPDPVQRPTAFYFRGECRRELGNISAAKADYDAAVKMQVDTHHARLARSKLGEIWRV